MIVPLLLQFRCKLIACVALCPCARTAVKVCVCVNARSHGPVGACVAYAHYTHVGIHQRHPRSRAYRLSIGKNPDNRREQESALNTLSASSKCAAPCSPPAVSSCDKRCEGMARFALSTTTTLSIILISHSPARQLDEGLSSTPS